MARTGRPRKTTPSVQWSVQVPKPLNEFFEVILSDPVYDGIIVGSKSTLVVELLTQLQKEFQKPGSGSLSTAVDLLNRYAGGGINTTTPTATSDLSTLFEEKEK